jgi:M61 glycyl aminopeptidase
MATPSRYWPRATAVLAAVALSIAAGSSWGTEIIRDSRNNRLELTISEHFSPSSKQQIRLWIEQLSESLTLVYGHWPRQVWAIEVAPASGSSNDPIPWARVHRGKVDRVNFYVVGSATAAALGREWTGYHELSHLLLPYRGWGETWFSEGLASYYQNILQARAGVITEQEMWQKLYQGFRRGREDNHFDGQTLLSVNSKMRSNGGYMRVYWSGAWYFLTADIALRTESNGRKSLDNALQRLNACCAHSSLSVPEMIDVMDLGSTQNTFRRHYGETRESKQMPPFESLFKQLGITLENGQLILQQDGPQAELRQQFLHSTAL